MDEQPFRNEINKQQKSIVEHSISILRASFSKAVIELLILLKSNNENVRLKASEKIIEYNISIAEMKELEERVEILEGKLF